MSTKYDYHEKYADYQEQYARPETRRSRRKRKKAVHHVAKKSDEEILADIAETIGLEGGFNTSYTPSLHEETFLLDAIRPFYDAELIDDVLLLVKGGKEANVYCCQAGAAGPAPLLAAKVYRPRQFRVLRNDAVYREGRTILDNNGVAVRKAREQRAIANKTDFGVNVQHTSWLAHEFTAMDELWHAGAAVPQPHELTANAVLMSYIGDDSMAAPILNRVRLAPKAARRLLEKLLYNIELMLATGWIHGDLSAFNILYWEDDVTIIDFPQVVDPQRNRSAYALLQRDVERVCAYFDRQRAYVDAAAFTQDVWQRHYGRSRADFLADESRYLVQHTQDESDAAAEWD